MSSVRGVGFRWCRTMFLRPSVRQAELSNSPDSTTRSREQGQGASVASGHDLGKGTALVVLFTLLSVILFALFDGRPGFLAWGALFWGVILIIRGFRLRREAWQLEHLGFIQRERDAEHVDDRR